MGVNKCRQESEGVAESGPHREDQAPKSPFCWLEGNRRRSKWPHSGQKKVLSPAQLAHKTHLKLATCSRRPNSSSELPSHSRSRHPSLPAPSYRYRPSVRLCPNHFPYHQRSFMGNKGRPVFWSLTCKGKLLQNKGTNEMPHSAGCPGQIRFFSLHSAGLLEF